MQFQYDLKITRTISSLAPFLLRLQFLIPLLDKNNLQNGF